MGIALITNNILSDSGTAVAGLVPTSRTISTTSPLTGGGDLSADRTIAIPAATSTVNGYLSSVDWTTFNAKQAAGNYVTLDTIQTVTARKTFSDLVTLSAIQVKSGAPTGLFLQSFNSTQLEVGATVSGTTYYSTLTFPGSSRAYTFPSASGTIALTSDIPAVAGVYLPLSGGTLTGALGGTTAGFTGTITSNGNLISNGGVIAPLNGGSIEVYNTGNSNYFDLKSVAGNFALRTNVGAGAVNALTITSSGAATFSSSVTATSIASVFKEGFIVQATTTGGGGSQPAYTYYTAAGSKRWSSFLNVGDDKFHIANASNSELFTIQQNGNVGIGTTSPIFALDIFTSSYKTFRIQSSDDAILTIGSTISSSQNWSIGATANGSGQGSNLFFIGTSTNNPSGLLTKNLAITSSGNVLIGTTADSGAKLQIRSSTAQTDSVGLLQLEYTSSAAGNAGLTTKNSYGTGQYMQWESFGLRFGSRILTSTGQGNLYITAGADSVVLTILASGASTFASSVTATSFFESSSILYKNILATNPVTSLNVDVIKYKRTNVDMDDVRYGYSAEQINSLMPELTNKEATAVKYLDVHTLLIAELQREIKELKARLN